MAGLQAAFGKMADAVAGLADGMSKLADAVRTLQAEPRGIGPDALKDAVRGELAKRTTALRFGKTAGQILRDGGFPGVKGLAGWAGHRLRAV